MAWFVGPAPLVFEDFCVMKMRSSFRCRLIGTLLALSVFGLVTDLYAQAGLRTMPPTIVSAKKQYKSNVTIESVGMTKIDTRDFFPQISHKITPKRIMPQNKRVRKPMKRGIANTLKSGDVLGLSSSGPSSNFPGLGATIGIPSDTNMAAGPTRLVQTVNVSIAFYEKDGTKIFEQAADDFFSSLRPTIGNALDFIFDPRVTYDRFNNRFVLVYDTSDDAASKSFQVIAVSDDSDPAGAWSFFAYDTTISVGGTPNWLDYPMVGLNPDAIVISGNLFGFVSGFGGVQTYVIPTAGLYSGTGSTATGFYLGTNSWPVHPAVSYTPGNFIYALEAAESTSVRVFAFGSLTGSPTLVSQLVSVPAWNFAPGVAPSGGGVGHDTLNDRIMNSMYRDDFLLGTHTISTEDNRARVRWYEIFVDQWPLTGTPTLAQSGNITLPSGEHAFMPAIAKNSLGDISIIYTRSSGNIFGDLVFSTRYEDDPFGTMGAPTLMRNSTNSKRFASRWGDYFSCVVDPFDELTFWGNGQLSGDGIIWETEIQSWEVSIDAGTEYQPFDASTYQGTYVSGDATTVVANDDAGFEIDSDLIPGLGEYAAIIGDTFIAEEPDKVTQLLFSFDTALISGSTATGTIFLFNFETGEYDYAKAFPMRMLSGDAVQSLRLRGDAVAKYIDSSGQIRVLIRAHEPYRRSGNIPTPFRMMSDWMNINVRSRR